jgi:hypothetical protein
LCLLASQRLPESVDGKTHPGVRCEQYYPPRTAEKVRPALGRQVHQTGIDRASSRWQRSGAASCPSIQFLIRAGRSEGKHVSEWQGRGPPNYTALIAEWSIAISRSHCEGSTRRSKRWECPIQNSSLVFHFESETRALSWKPTKLWTTRQIQASLSTS